MFATLLLLLQAASTPPALPPPPVIDEGWVFPTERGQRASSVCPVIGRITAEFVQGGGGLSFKLSGMGSTSTPKDQKTIIDILGPLSGWQSIDVSCWGNQAGYIVVSGLLKQGKMGEVGFLWTSDGPKALNSNAIYPSVPSNALPRKK